MEIFNVLWNRHDEKTKYIVGYLIYDQNWFFIYNNNMIMQAIEKGFRPFAELSDIHKLYTSKHLFHTFRLRINSQDEEIKILKNTDSSLFTDNILILYKKKGDNETNRRNKM